MREGSPEGGQRVRAGGRTPGSRARRGGSGPAVGTCAGTPICPPDPGFAHWQVGQNACAWERRATLRKVGGAPVLGGGSELPVPAFLRSGGV